MRAVAIHLIENDGRFKLIDKTAGIYETGFWNVSPATADELALDGRIYLHHRQREPSFLGGAILHQRQSEDGEYAGRIIFTFRALPGCKNVKATGARWAQEKMIVRA